MSLYCLQRVDQGSHIELLPGSLVWEPISCSAIPDHARTGKRITDLVFLSPKQERHVYWTWYSDCLVTDEFREAVIEDGLRGAQFRPARSAKPGDVSLWELRAGGWGGTAPPSSGIRIVDRCATCGLLEYSCWEDGSRIIDWRKWDGSDFFMIWPLPMYLFVSDRVGVLLSEHGFTGAQLMDADKLKCESGLTPGRLSQWIPLNQARERAGPLDII
jgi:hypothetical protein